MVLSLLFFTATLLSSAAVCGALEVRYQAGLLSVTAHNVALSQVLEEVAYKTGMEIRVLDAGQQKVSVRFSGLPVREGLQKLLAYLNYILLEKKVAKGEMRPALVLVLGQAVYPPSEKSLNKVTSKNGRSPKGNLTAGGDSRNRLRALHAAASAGNEGAIRAALSDPDPIIQAASLDLLNERDREGSVGLLFNATKSPQPQTRFRAFELLNNNTLADQGAVMSALGEALLDDDAHVKRFAIRALAERGGPQAFEYLRQALRDSDPSIRIVTIDYVVRTVPSAQGLALLEEASLDGDETVRSAAAAGIENRRTIK